MTLSEIAKGFGLASFVGGCIRRFEAKIDQGNDLEQTVKLLILDLTPQGALRRGLLVNHPSISLHAAGRRGKECLCFLYSARGFNENSEKY
ncbi:MAG: hypothetical protein L0H73_15815 [Nitrococcus sp.]|nr:hypothetical protein [Nitrococcus sp.]